MRPDENRWVDLEKYRPTPEHTAPMLCIFLLIVVGYEIALLITEQAPTSLIQSFDPKSLLRQVNEPALLSVSLVLILLSLPLIGLSRDPLLRLIITASTFFIISILDLILQQLDIYPDEVRTIALPLKATFAVFSLLGLTGWLYAILAPPIIRLARQAVAIPGSDAQQKSNLPVHLAPLQIDGVLADQFQIALKLRRLQRAGALGKLYFCVDARMGVHPSDRKLIEKYNLGRQVVYDSKDRQKYMANVSAHLQDARGNPVMAPAKEQGKGAMRTFYKLGRAGLSAAAAALKLRITVNGLMSGVHIECKNLNEVLEAEEAIINAVKNVKSFLETAATFDGREELIQI